MRHTRRGKTRWQAAVGKYARTAQHASVLYHSHECTVLRVSKTLFNFLHDVAWTNASRRALQRALPEGGRQQRVDIKPEGEAAVGVGASYSRRSAAPHWEE